jgi:hypothetical protein
MGPPDPRDIVPRHWQAKNEGFNIYATMRILALPWMLMAEQS